MVITQDFNYRFSNITTERGLPLSIVNKVKKDRTGYVWFSYEGGIARFDGYHFKTFSYNPYDTNSLPLIFPGKFDETADGKFFFFNKGKSFLFDPVTYQIDYPDIPVKDITCFLLDNDSSIWLASESGGLYHFQKDFSLIHNIPLSELPPLGADKKYMNQMFLDFDGSIWISMRSCGIIKYHPRTQEIKHYPSQLEEYGVIKGKSKLIGSKVNVFCQVTEDAIWIGTVSGIVKLDITDEIFTHYSFQDFNINDPTATTVDHVFHHNGILWLGTYKNGIYLFDINKEVFISHLTSDEDDPFSLNSNEIRDLYYANHYKDGILWVATLNGISYIDLYQKPFELYHNQRKDKSFIHSKNIRTIYADNSYLMFGGEAGLDVFSKKSNQREFYSFSQQNKHSIGAGIVSSVTRIAENKYYITTWSGSFNEFNPLTKTFRTWQSYHNNIGLTGWTFTDGHVDNQGNYWLLTLKDFLLRKPENSQQFLRVPDTLQTEVDNIKAKQIYQHSSFPDEIIWLPSDFGLIRYNARTNELSRFLYKEHQLHSICDIFFSLHIDDEGWFWIGTGGCGLLKYNIRTDDLRFYTQNDGLPSNNVYAVVEDEQGFLWLSTSNGISKFDKVTETCQNYFKSDGLQANEFNWGAFFKDADGKIYFGGINGVTSFYPAKIKNNPFKPDLNFTTLYVKNRMVSMGDTLNGQVILKQPLNAISDLKINHKNNDFAIEFMSTHFANPEKNMFKYRLSGYDEEWKTVTAPNNRAYFANISPGRYKFEAFASNLDGIWSENPRTLDIVILPPWWQTWWFRVFFVLVFLTLWFTYIRVRTSRYKRQQKVLEKLVKEKTTELTNANKTLNEKNEENLIMAKKLHESDQSKINFLTNISHEFRTPLTLILGPVASLIREIPDRMKHVRLHLDIIQRNSQRLLRLINQLLDISDIDAGTMKLKVVEECITDFILVISQSFEFRAQKNSIQLNVEMPENKVVGYFDGDKIEKVLYNLISNAIKFTDKGGVVSVKVKIITHELLKNYHFELAEKPKGRYAIVQISDTGSGIPPEDMDRIFERFFQANNNSVRKTGTGIGLSLSKQLIQKHKGQIQVISEPGKGSEFVFCFPIDKSAFYPGEIVDHQIDIHERIEAIHSIETVIPQSESISISAENTREILLLVEDNTDMRLFIKDNFCKRFLVLEAANGKQGLSLALSELPDIIISDIMMPEMDGIEMCNHLKSNELTSHIPVILVTAKSGDENEIKGLEFGAEDYITKPFNIETLKLKVNNLLRLREKIQKSNQPLRLETASNMNVMDEKFLDKVNLAIDQYISDPNLNAEKMAGQIGYSRPHLYRKLMALTGKNITEYIRVYRLTKAIELVRINDGSISEIAYKVGFSNPSYFTRKFRELFGKPPNEFKK